MWTLLISLLFSSGSPSPPSSTVHDFHVSRLTANYKPSEGRIECTLMTFVDDVEGVLTNHHQLQEFSVANTALPSKEDLNLTEPDEHPLLDSLLFGYIQHALHFSDSLTGEHFEINYLGKERDDDPYGMFIYFYIEEVPLSRNTAELATPQLTLESTYMLERYEDQQNVVVWKLNGEAADYDLLTNDSRICDFKR